jgi:hypothetical protein
MLGLPELQALLASSSLADVLKGLNDIRSDVDLLHSVDLSVFLNVLYAPMRNLLVNRISPQVCLSLLTFKRLTKLFVCLSL